MEGLCVEANESTQTTEVERAELKNALTELDGWIGERRSTIRSLEKYIQTGLQTGRITECRKEGTGKKYLTQRMIATLRADESMLLRSLLFLHCRRRQILKQMNSLDEKIAAAQPVQSDLSQENRKNEASETTTETEDSTNPPNVLPESA